MNLEVAKKRLDIKKLYTSIDEYEYKILEKMADIERVKGNIEKAKEAIEKYEQELKDMEA